MPYKNNKIDCHLCKEKILQKKVGYHFDVWVIVPFIRNHLSLPKDDSSNDILYDIFKTTNY